MTTLILGMPRSGTSLLTQILEDMGANLSITEPIDELYMASHKFYQDRKIHFYVCNQLELQTFKPIASCPSDIEKLTKLLENKKIVKEPYLLGLLPYIHKFIKNIILVIRVPAEVVESIDKFSKENNIEKKIRLKEWTDYYDTFTQFMNIFHIPFVVVSYHDILKNPELVIKTIHEILPELSTSEPYSYQHLIKAPLIRLSHSVILPIETSFIFSSLIKKTSINTIVSKMILLKKAGANSKCFCSSGKKYKKCCVYAQPE